MRTLLCITTAFSVFGLCAISTPRSFAEERKERSQPASEKQEMTYLGVSTFYLSPSLREYLEISEGFGIQILEVLPDSPAAKAGLKEKDVLLRFNDQLLISPEHLSLLVKREKPGSEISLLVLRKGAEEKLTVELGAIDRQSQGIRPRPENHRMSPEQWQNHLKEQQDYWQRWINKRQPNRHPEKPKSEKDEENPELSGRPPAVSVSPGFPVRIFGTKGVLKIDNDEGEVSIFREDEAHRIVIKDAESKEIYSGDYDPALGIERLPEEAQDHLKRMKLENLEILAPQGSEEAPERTSSPMPPAPKAEEEVL